MIRPGYVTQVLTNYGADHDTPPLDLQNLIARKYDEQIKFKVDGPSSRFVTESVSSALFPHARVVKKLQNSYLLMFVFRLEKNSILLPTMQHASARKQPCQFQTVFISTAAYVSGPMTASRSRFSCPLFAVYVGYDVF